jgi:2,4-dienoyl-CoA reductase-like NADH-dependent reductase (Old Yellow Enzyme family)
LTRVDTCACADVACNLKALNFTMGIILVDILQIIFMAKLFEPLSIRSVTLKNRIVVSPMCEYSSDDGFANDWHMVHLGSRAVGGAGLVITEACAVSPEGMISPHDLGIWKDEHISNLERITKFIQAQGAVPGIQLAHAGRKASCAEPWKGGQQLSLAEGGGWQVVAPSAVPFKEGTMVPLALNKEGIQKLLQDFRLAAKRSLQAGFQLIEIHAAHGYLLHEFLSPLSNFREDAYGGSFENRCRLLLEVISAVRTEWPEELPLFVRISATDWVEGAWDINDSVAVSKMMKLAGVDLVDCSSGGNVHTAIPLSPGYQVPFAGQVKREADILTGAVGLITEAQQAETILANGEADLVILARELLRDPYFPLHAASQLGHVIEWPVQYQRAKK